MEGLTFIKNTAIIIISYLFGAAPFCYLIAKIHSGKDLRKIGERNPGSMNLMFNVSKSLGILGGFLDFLKGFIAYFISYRISNSLPVAVLAGSAAVLGHNYSPYLKFSGGKGMATTIGVLFAANPFSVIAFGVVNIGMLFILKNIIWSIILGILGASIFIYIFDRSGIFLILLLLLLIIVIPKYMTFSKEILEDFKINRSTSVKDLLYEEKKYNKP